MQATEEDHMDNPKLEIILHYYDKKEAQTYFNTTTIQRL